jgi:hypothetical protein
MRAEAGLAILAHAKGRDPDVHGMLSICNSVYARYSISCITWSFRPCAFILIPGRHEDAIATGWLSICYSRSTAMPDYSVARLLAALLVFRPVVQPACLPYLPVCRALQTCIVLELTRHVLRGTLHAR